MSALENYGLECILARIIQLENQMATISQELAQVKLDLDATKVDLAQAAAGIAGLQSTVAALNQSIADLQAQLSGGILNADQQAALDALVTEGDETKAAADALAASFPATAPA